MARPIRRPTDPDELAELEGAEKAHAAKMADRAGGLRRGAEKLRIKKATAEQGRKLEDAKNKVRSKEARDYNDRIRKQREEYLSTPLSNKEVAELVGIEDAANSGHQPQKRTMMRLIDLRKRSENKREAA